MARPRGPRRCGSCAWPRRRRRRRLRRQPRLRPAAGPCAPRRGRASTGRRHRPPRHRLTRRRRGGACTAAATGAASDGAATSLRSSAIARSHLRRQLVHVGHRAAAGDQAEADLVDVALHRDVEGDAMDDDRQRVVVGHLRADQVHRHLRAGHVGDRHVGEAQPVGDARAAVQRRQAADQPGRAERREVGRDDAAEGAHLLLHRRGAALDRLQPLGRIGLVRAEVDQRCRRPGCSRSCRLPGAARSARRRPATSRAARGCPSGSCAGRCCTATAPCR